MSPGMEALIEWAKVLLGFAGPIMVVWVTAKMNRTTRDREEKEAESLKKQQERDEKVQNSIDALSTKVDSMDTELASVKSSIEEMKRMDAKVHTDLAMLNRYHEMNVKHIQKVSNTLVQIGEGLRDQNIDGRFTSSVNELRTFETTMYTELFGKTPLASDEDQPRH